MAGVRRTRCTIALAVRGREREGALLVVARPRRRLEEKEKQKHFKGTTFIMATSAAANILNTIASRRDRYAESIKVNHTLAKGAAQRIRELENLLLHQPQQPGTGGTGGGGTGGGILTGVAEEGGDDADERDALAAFFRAQKDAVLQIARDNVERERNVDAFCAAVCTVRGLLEQQERHQLQCGGVAELDLIDHQKEIDIVLQQQRRASVTTPNGTGGTGTDTSMQLDVRQEALYREVAEAMGEPVPLAATAAAANHTNSKKRGGSHTNDDNDDDDDDIQVSEAQGLGGMGGGGGSDAALKCPITGAYMHDAVRNRVCKHVYSRAGIAAHIANSSHHNSSHSRSQQQHSQHNAAGCPTVGCGNRAVTLSQLEDDVATNLLVRRVVRRQEQQKEKQSRAYASQADDLVDSDDEDE